MVLILWACVFWWLTGPQCVFSCANEHRSLPKQGFTCCLALDGVNVLASGFEADEKVWCLLYARVLGVTPVTYLWWSLIWIIIFLIVGPKVVVAKSNSNHSTAAISPSSFSFYFVFSCLLLSWFWNMLSLSLSPYIYGLFFWYSIPLFNQVNSRISAWA